MSESLTGLLKTLPDTGNTPPIEDWQPAFCGDIAIRIDRQGDWFHQGEPIRRQGLVALFASILRREEDGEYYLVTPVEKWRIEVEDAPFVIIAAARSADNNEIYFTANTGRDYLLSQQYPLNMVYRQDGEPRPYLQLDRRLPALISRGVFYQLVDWATPQQGELLLHSAQQQFSLGHFHE